MSAAGDLDHFVKAAGLTDRLRSDFAVIANVVGPWKATGLFAKSFTEPYEDNPETVDRMVRICRALYDDYVATHPPEAPLA